MSFQIKDNNGNIKKDLNKPFWLHQSETKFWEIWLKGLQTTIRCGKIICLDPIIEEPDKTTSQKTHANKDTAIQYIEKHVNTKLGRGYVFIEDNKRKRSDSQDSDVSASSEPTKKMKINIIPPDSNNNSQSQQNQLTAANLLSVNNNNYSDTSKKPSLSELTDISQQKSNNPSINGSTNTNVKGLGGTHSGCINVLLAKKWEKDIDPTGWYMSEKMDGVRAFWNGSTLYSRNKNVFWAPDFWKKKLPKCQLDGELWVARDDFRTAVSIVKRQKSSVESDWEKIKYVVYDIPGLNKPFKDRVKAMEQELSKLDNPYLIVHPQVKCQGNDQLEEELAKILEKGGEGVMLRDPNSQYEGVRSDTLLKVKVMHDEEATVIGYADGSRSGQGLIGALVCKNDDGIEFKVGQGLTDAQRKKPPKKGSRITYKYQNKQPSGKPRFPIFLRVHPGV